MDLADSKPFPTRFDQSWATNLLRFALGFSALATNVFLLGLIAWTPKLRANHGNCLIALLAAVDCLIGLCLIISDSVSGV